MKEEKVMRQQGAIGRIAAIGVIIAIIAVAFVAIGYASFYQKQNSRQSSSADPTTSQQSTTATGAFVVQMGAVVEGYAYANVTVSGTCTLAPSTILTKFNETASYDGTLPTEYYTTTTTTTYYTTYLLGTIDSYVFLTASTAGCPTR